MPRKPKTGTHGNAGGNAGNASRGYGDRRVEWMELDSVKGAERNPKRHALEEIGQSIGRHGVAELPLLDERTGRLVAGHGRIATLRKMRDAGEPAPAGVVDEGDGRWVVPVLRGWASRSDADAAAYLVGSNQTTILGGWDQAELGELLREIEEADALAGTGFGADEVAELLEAAEADGAGGEGLAAEEDPANVIPEAPKVSRTELGDLWALGDHRLLVGDSFNAQDRARLLGDAKPAVLLTDPPYAIYGSSSGIASDIADDNMVRPFFAAVFEAARLSLPKFAHLYVFNDWRSWASLIEGVKRGGLGELAAKNMLVWDKGGSGLGSAYAQTHELIFFGAKLPPQTAMGHREAGQRVVHQPNVFSARSDPRYNRPHGEEREHNAAKPVGLLEDLIENSTDPGQTVLELFTGSGSTLIASERKGRRCLAMEISPMNATITLNRWERITGKKAELLERAPAADRKGQGFQTVPLEGELQPSPTKPAKRPKRGDR